MSSFGIMYHHFCDERHPKGQGAISREELRKMLEFLGPERILPAEDWLERAIAGALGENDLCITFDDALLCQYDVAVPVLREFQLTAFWFVYSGVFEGRKEMLELYRHFRTTRFESIDEFYESFIRYLEQREPAVRKTLESFDPDTYLEAFPFYSRNDRVFRYLRDEVLRPDRYHEVMQGMMKECDYAIDEASQSLWMHDDHLLELAGGGHVVGLHSYSHPTRLAELSEPQQRSEYERNRDHLVRVLGAAPRVMSHPCNSYGKDTLSLLRDMGIECGFRANMAHIPDRSELEYQREDHANLMKEMEA